MVARDLELAALTGARYHVAHMSGAESVRLVREAKRRGLPVTCEVTPHHLTLTDEACATYDTFCKCNPPLRTAADVEALREALADGTIDAIATDHAPHSPVEKDVEFEHAAFGMIGLETALPLCLDLVRAGRAVPAALVSLLTDRPGRGPGLPGGHPGARSAGRRHRHPPRTRLDLRPGAIALQIEEHALRGSAPARQGRADSRGRTHRPPGGDPR